MRIGVVILPTDPWPEARAVWQRAEALGAHTAWTYDHLTWRELRDGPWHAAVPLLAAVAATTSTMRIGTLVASPNFRHPVTLAKEAMTLDGVSEGRMTLGLGSGGTGWDASALGQEPWSGAERAGRFAEFVDALDRLLVDPSVERLEGTWYSARDARCLPGCVQAPRLPFAVAGSGRRAMDVAARHGQTWVTYGAGGQGLSPAESLVDVQAQVARLEEACERIGRDPSSIDRLLLVGVTAEPWLESAASFDDLSGAYADLGFTDLALHWPRATEPYVSDPEVFESILAAHAEPGHARRTRPPTR